MGKAHELGLNTKQAQELLNYFGVEQTQFMQEMANEADKQHQSLVKEWGDKYDENFKAAKAGAAFVLKDHPDLKEALSKTGMDSHPAIVKFFKAMNDEYNEGKSITPEGDEGKPNIMTAEEKTKIEEEIAAVRKEYSALPAVEREMKSKAYGKKLQALYAKLYPKGAGEVDPETEIIDTLRQRDY